VLPIRISLSVSLLAVVFLSGCGSSRTSSILSVAGDDGTVLGGSQPISNATIQLYSVGTSGDHSFATPLLTKTVTTDSNGSFSIEGSFSCANATEVYLTATGGDPTPGTVNGNLALMTALGPCASLNSQMPIVVSELTTVAAVNALVPYMTSYIAVGAGSDDAASLNNAFTLATEFVNPETGTSPGLNLPSGYTVPTTTIDTLADMVAACVNSGGGVAGDGSPCGNLFSLTTPPNGNAPTNTISALLFLASDPGLNTSSLYQLASLNTSYEPQLPSVPSNFAVALVAPLVPPTPPAASSLVLNLTSIAFPSTAIGSMSGVQDATLTNTGDYSASLSGIQIGGTGSSDFTETNNCLAALAAGESCTILITFSPQNNVTPNATLTVNDGQLSLALSGSLSETSNVPQWPSAVLAATPLLYLNFNDQTSSFLDQISGQTFSSGGGAVATQQPGFDNTTPNNYSAAFSWNAYSAAPNDTLGSLEWNVPWTMMIHIDRLNWNRQGALVLASKGDLGACAGVLLCNTSLGAPDSWWQLFIAMNWNSTSSQLCFMRNGYGKAPAQQAVCTGGATNSFEGMPNGFNYNIVVEDSGTGAPGALSMYINGLQVGSDSYIPGFTWSNTYSNGFGNVALSVSGGTGYADSTAFTSTGGGPNCNVTGFMWASNGVPYNGNWTPTGTNNYGCTSTPTIVLTSPTGTGAVITAISAPMSMNSSTQPLMVPGYVSKGVAYGVAGSNSAAPPTNVDEFAIFPGNLTFKQITALFYETKFYQNEVFPGLTATPPLVILEGNGCGPDFSGDQTVAMTIGAAKAGLIQLIGAIDDDGNPNGTNSVGWWRQMLDEAGFANVPLSVGPNSPDPNTGGCPAANITAYNASTPQNASSYESSVTMLRTLYAEYSTQPIYMLMTQAANGYSAFVSSPADSISPLTGLQLQAQNAANGAWMNMFQGNLSLTPNGYTTIWTHNGNLPIYMLGGTPQPGGPGILVSRPPNDPLYMAAIATGGKDTISGWTNLNLSQVITPMFWGGVTISYSGGTGYANSTPFTSTGGGADCHVTGIMTASGGVPNGIETYWGESFPASSTYNGIGYGCTSPPTIVLTTPTGTGVTLTASTTYAVTCYGSSGCNNQYVVWPNVYSAQIGGVGIEPIFQWFQNSLIDPPVN
jgi:hypothetical protein